jgi:hypothetical protein
MFAGSLPQPPARWLVSTGGGLSARAVGESIFTQAASAEELHARILDAVRFHFEDKAAPRLIRLHFVRDEVIAA